MDKFWHPLIQIRISLDNYLTKFYALQNTQMFYSTDEGPKAQLSSLFSELLSFFPSSVILLRGV